MRIAVLGTGIVGSTIASKLVEQGHEVKLGARTRGNEKAIAWVKRAGSNASEGSFADAASFGETAFNCTAGAASLAALEAAGSDHLRGKMLIDVANPLDFSRGMPPTLTVANTDSLGEQIQRALPDTRVVKALNTVTAALMVNPAQVPGQHVLFIGGNDESAKAQVATWLNQWLGWRPEQILDLGDITAARATEMMIPLWVRLYMTLGSPLFNYQINRGG
jgi:predicted dinucleotide-binding enzyme